ncbi:MAG: hypothetical protein FJW20_11930 [Acidimicrobiia bacterium]|nr:hypothetical protein [Acidimicrobiia bacterium]
MVPSVLLVHWKKEEAAPRLERLRKAGFSPRLFDSGTPESLRSLSANPPDAVVIDLTRLPSHGRTVGAAMRQRKALRNVPIVFVEGDPEKVEKVRQMLPDAVYTTWPKAGAALKRALKNPLPAPVVPEMTISYKDTPLIKKLGIAAESKVVLLGAPETFERRLNPLPPGAEILHGPKVKAHRVFLFARSMRDLEARFHAAERSLAEGGGLWIAWPKQSSGVASDLNQNILRAYAMERGLVDYKICSIDEIFSGMLFARRAR